MKKTSVALLLILLALLGSAFYLFMQNSQLQTKLVELESAQASATCDSKFPSGLFRLVNDTDYSPGLDEEYEIYHVSVALAEWRINVGLRVNAQSTPTEFYVDYNGDGIIDTAIAARFARELPIAGISIADRLLADSRVHQNLYAVFSCEWRNAEFTSSEDINNSVSGTSKYLWYLVQEHSDSLVEWIEVL